MLKILVLILIVFKINTSGVMMVTDGDIIIRLIKGDQMPYFNSYYKSK